MSLRPYIGITDFTSFEQVERMLKVFQKHKPPGSDRQLHVGVMMSFRTLNGLETRWSKAFPPKENIHSIFGFSAGDTYNCLHYADYKHPQEFSKDLARAISYGGIGIDAVQLDMIWPDPIEIDNALYISRKQIEVILQIGKNAFEMVGNNPAEVVRRLEEYEGIIHRVLLDKSVGRGVSMDAVELLPFAHAIRDRFPELGLVSAGGLGPNSTELAAPLVAQFPDLSIDAQGKLRPSGSALDPIDWNMAETYLTKALELFK